MSLHRVKQRLARMLAEHEEGERDGHAPTAQAHATLAAHLREDIAALDEARAEVDLLRAMRDEARADVVRLARERDEAIARAERADAALAALREAADAASKWLLRIPWDPQHLVTGSQDRIRLRTVLADTEAAAEEHDRRVRQDGYDAGRRAAISSGARVCDAPACSAAIVAAEDGARCCAVVRGLFALSAAEVLRARADEIERGER